jgi:SAM-dependent methyltransferase
MSTSEGYDFHRHDASRASRACPLCGMSSAGAKVFVEERIDGQALTGFAFASRKVPEFMSHRLVRCAGCDLVYVDRPPSQNVLAEAYHVASYDSAEEAEDAARAYIHAIEPTLRSMATRERALEIGAGTGVFLEHLRRAGFTTVVGVEPSSAAIAAAPEERSAWLRESIFRESDFAPESFDLICCFMTLEHVRDPGELVRAAFRLLRPGGALVTVTHDYRSIVNRVLGKRSPIIDIEHMQLFSKPSLRRLFEDAGYQGVATTSFVNRYSLRYWTRLAPIPAGLKWRIERLLQHRPFDRVKLGINVGNVIAAGHKPE